MPYWNPEKKSDGVLVLGMLMVTCAFLLLALASARNRALRLGLRADSLVAVADTLRLVHADSLRVWQRRAVQVPQSGGTRVIVKPVLQIDTIRLVDTAFVVGDTIRRATFLRYQPPVTLNATVTMPPAPGVAELDATLTHDPIPVDVRVVCGRDRDGVRPVEASVTTPLSVTLRMTTPEVSPEVCNRVVPRRPWWVWPAISAAFVGGLALSW